VLPSRSVIIFKAHHREVFQWEVVNPSSNVSTRPCGPNSGWIVVTVLCLTHRHDLCVENASDGMRRETRQPPEKRGWHPLLKPSS
jgi:hypothetical protein